MTEKQQALDNIMQRMKNAPGRPWLDDTAAMTDSFKRQLNLIMADKLEASIVATKSQLTELLNSDDGTYSIQEFVDAAVKKYENAEPYFVELMLSLCAKQGYVSFQLRPPRRRRGVKAHTSLRAYIRVSELVIFLHNRSELQEILF